MATKSLALGANKEDHMFKSAEPESCEDAAAAGRGKYWKSRLFAIQSKILRRIQIYCCFGNDKKQESLKKLQNDRDEGEFKSLFLCGQI